MIVILHYHHLDMIQAYNKVYCSANLLGEQNFQTNFEREYKPQLKFQDKLIIPI